MPRNWAGKIPSSSQQSQQKIIEKTISICLRINHRCCLLIAGNRINKSSRIFVGREKLLSEMNMASPLPVEWHFLCHKLCISSCVQTSSSSVSAFYGLLQSTPSTWKTKSIRIFSEDLIQAHSNLHLLILSIVGPIFQEKCTKIRQNLEKLTTQTKDNNRPHQLLPFSLSHSYWPNSG